MKQSEPNKNNDDFRSQQHIVVIICSFFVYWNNVQFAVIHRNYQKVFFVHFCCCRFLFTKNSFRNAISCATIVINPIPNLDFDLSFEEDEKKMISIFDTKSQ